MALEKLLPGRLAGQVWLGIVAMLQEDVLDRGLADSVSEVHGVIADSGVAPAGVLLFESDHEINDLLRDLGPSGTLAVLTAIVFLGDESAILLEHGLGREQNGGLLQKFSGQLFGFCGQPSSLGFVEQNAFILLLLFLQDPDLLLEVVDGLPEFLVEATSQARYHRKPQV